MGREKVDRPFASDVEVVEMVAAFERCQLPYPTVDPPGPPGGRPLLPGRGPLRGGPGGRPAYDATAEVSLYIATAYQRRGIGRRFTQWVID